MNSTTIGILYPGEMGASLASLLRAGGARVVTTLGGRSANTARRSHEAGIQVLPSMIDLAREASIVLSVVSPAAAEEVAQAYCEVARVAPAGAVYVDVNSIRPELVNVVAERFSRVGAGFVDAAINGLAKNLSTSGTLFLSGEGSADVAALFASRMRVRILGDQPGQASAMKMLLSGVSKGICGLFAELSLLAQRQGVLDELLQETAHIYPGVAALTSRMLPTYAQHAARRAAEMQELEQTARSGGVEPCVISAVRQVHELLASLSLERSGATVASMIQQLQAEDFLARRASSPSANADSAGRA